MPKIQLKNITKRWGKFYAVDNLSLDVEDNSFITLLGPSGCGKTTILRMIAGLETPTTGQIYIDGKVVFDSERGINLPANDRKVGFLFQNYALWPNMTVYQNISFGLSNVKEDLPTYDYEHRNNKRLIEILQDPRKVVELTNESRDKKGKLNKDIVHLIFIDEYKISQYTAKDLFDFKLHDSPDVQTKSASIIKDLEAKIRSSEEGYQKKGQSLGENSAIVENNQIVTKVRKLSKEEIDLRVRQVARTVKIGMFMDRYPSELSGGQQQRVAIARTLAPEPAVLFMDEPLSNLDAKLRLEMRYELQRLHVETGSTFVYVTHDQMEAMTLATKICLVDNGILQQYAAPLTVYNKPNNIFVGDFVGSPSINFIEAEGRQNNEGNIDLSILNNINVTFKPNQDVSIDTWLRERDTEESLKQARLDELSKEKGYVEKENKDVKFQYHIDKIEEHSFVRQEEETITNADFVLGVRPELFEINEDGALDGIIHGAMPTGMESTIKIRIGDFLLTAVIFGNHTYPLGKEIKFDITSDAIMLFDRKSGKYITSGTLEIRK